MPTNPRAIKVRSQIAPTFEDRYVAHPKDKSTVDLTVSYLRREQSALYSESITPKKDSVSHGESSL